MLYKFIDSTRIELQPTSLIVGNRKICIPSESVLRENGYKDLVIEEKSSEYSDCYYTDGDVITMKWQKWGLERRQSYYPQLVDELIREKYSVSDELALLRQRDTKTEEFEVYNAFAEECKTEAKSRLELE